MNFKLNLLLLISVASYAPVYSMLNVSQEEIVQQLMDKTGAEMVDCKKALEESGGDLEAAVKILEKRASLSGKIKKLALDATAFVKNKPKYSALFLYGLYNLKEASGKKYTLPLRLCSQALLTYNMYKNDKDTTWLRAWGYACLCGIGVRHSVIKIDASSYFHSTTVV